LPKGPPEAKDGPPCDCKGGNGSGSSKGGGSKDTGSGKKGDAQAAQDAGKEGGQGRDHGKLSIANGLGGFLPENDMTPEPSVANPAHRKLPALQLRNYRDIDPNVLKDLGMTPEDWQAFQKQLAERERQIDAEQLPPSQGGNTHNSAGTVNTERNGTGGAVKTGQGQVPPEFRKDFQKYTKGQPEKK